MKNKPTMRRIFNLVQIILLIIAVVMIITGEYGDFKQYEYIYDRISGVTTRITDEWRYENEIPVNMGTITFSSLQKGDPLWAKLTFGAVGLCILASLASIIRKSNDRDGLLHLFLPLLPLYSFFSFAVMAELSSNMREGYFNIIEYTQTPWTVLGIFAAVFFLAFVKRSKLFNKKDAVKVEVANANAAPVSNADELKKYKELLDTGVISQEEFDAKKKQLLNM